MADRLESVLQAGVLPPRTLPSCLSNSPVMLVDLSKWSRPLRLQKVDEKPQHVPPVRYTKGEVDKLDKLLTPT